MMASSWTPGTEPIAQKFEAAWQVFAASCAHLWANEASYQAWFAHYLIGQFGIDRVGREAIINEKHFEHNAGLGEVRPDAVVAREPGIMLPHYANGVARSADRSGIGILKHLAVISELKVGATTASGLRRSAILADIVKLGRLLNELHLSSPGAEMPLAYVCVLDNHPHQRFNLEGFGQMVETGGYHPGVKLITAMASQRPAAPNSGIINW